MTPRLSVVVPFFNIERYFPDCLDSLARQHLREVEFVLVDDGSEDSSRRIAEEYAARDPRFVIVTQDNAGPGPARNHGVAVSRGEYLAFADSDDVVAPWFYERALGILDGSGSDLLIAGAYRFSTLGVAPSWVHALAVKGTRTGTHASRSPELGLDRMIWNKLLRRGLWDDAGLEFAPIMLQDWPLSIAAHAAATSVDVLDEVGYYWRRREDGPRSVTDHNEEPAHLTDRLTSADLVLDVAEASLPASLPLVRHHLLEIDVPAFSLAATKLDGDASARVLAQGQQLLRRLGPAVVAESSGFLRSLAGALEAGDLDALGLLHEHVRRYGRQGRARRTEAGFVEDFGAGPAVPTGVPEVLAELAALRWDEGAELAVTLHVESPHPLRAEDVEVRLEAADGAAGPIVCPFRAAGVRGVFEEADAVEVHAGVDLAALVDEGRLTRTFWRFVATVRVDGAEVQVPVTESGRSRGRFLGPRPLPGLPGTVAQPGRRPGVGFGLGVQRPVAVVTGCALVGGEVLVEGRIRVGALADGTATPTRLTVTLGADLVQEVPVRLEEGDGQVRFAAMLPLAPYAAGADQHSPVPAQVSYGLQLDVGGTNRVLALAEDARPLAVPLGEKLLRATSSQTGNLCLVLARNDPEVTEVAWSSPSTLRFAGVWRGEEALPTEVVLLHPEHAGGDTARRTPLRHEGGGRYWFEVDVEALASLGSDGYRGSNPEPWHLLLPFASGARVHVHDRTRSWAFAEPRTVGSCRVEVRFAGADVVRVSVGGPGPDQGSAGA